ncbi:MAG TPA: hypothetical protein VJY62_01275, partial [Bacteroidia bacterium]|nr:hypothetical protein [Bacteroidia bacterium]
MRRQGLSGKIFFIPIFFFFYFFFPCISYAQPRSINVQVNFKVEEGNYEKSYMIMENVTTGEKQTLPGQSKYSVNLKVNNNYILSFNKPGYITKKIELNTSAPADRIDQGFYPVPMIVILIKQYDGVNIVVFNQPVAKYKYSKITDDFDYDTDYTKQIQSALKDAEDELAEKKKEEKANAGANAKVAEKAKQDSVAAAKAEAKAKLEEEQRQKAEAKAKQEEEAKARNDSIAQAKKDSFAKTEEEKRQQAAAKMEEDERKKASAKMEADERAKAAKALADEEARKKALAKQEEEDRRKLNASASAGNDGRKAAATIEGSDPKIKQNASANFGSDIHQLEKSEEVPANVSVEEITENNRSITKATVTSANKELIYLKIIYKWGGIFYFENDRSISKDAFQLAT